MILKPLTELTVLQPYVWLGDPHMWTDAKSRLSIRFAIYESLVRYDERGGYNPALAQGWCLETDARTWTFRLRDDVLFHNGDKLKAGDVVATLKRACDPEMVGELGTKGLFNSYLGGAVFKALDDRTVRLVTPEPMADLLDLLVRLPIVSQRALTDLVDRPVGSGPYRFVEAEDDCRVVMQRFEGYWGVQRPVEKLYWRAEPNTERRIDALLAGRADIITEVGLEGKQCIETTGQADVLALDSSLCVIFMCNAHTGVCTDRRVRRALNYALDVPRIIREVKGGAARPLNGPLTPKHFGYDPLTRPYPYDLDKARSLLAEAGYAGGLDLILDVPSAHPNEAFSLAQQLAEQYAQIDITTQIQTFSDRPAYAEMVKSKQIHDACCFDSSPLSTFRCLREKFHSGIAGPWWQGYRNPQVDALLEQAWTTLEDARRRECYRRAYRIIRDDAPWIFLYSPTHFWGVGPRARGWAVGIDELVGLV